MAGHIIFENTPITNIIGEISIKSEREFLAILRHPYLYINIIAL